MLDKIYIRPLAIEDALTSYKWRNDSEVWQYTGGRPDRIITAEIESDWISRIMQKHDEKRFAICVSETTEYIGNIQLTNIKDGEGQYHIFIGNKSFWGKGLAKAASLQILHFAFNELLLNSVFLEVNIDNVSAVNLYRKIGFEEQAISASQENFMRMAITKKKFEALNK